MPVRVKRLPGAVDVALAVLSIVSAAMATATARGEEPAAAIGSRVVMRAGAELKVGDAVVDTAKSHHIYTVTRENGEWLWLAAGEVAGWARAKDVIDVDRAIALYTEVLARNPTASATLHDRGLLKHDRRDYDGAIADYTEALKADPKMVPAWINRGNARQAKKEYDQAIADYNQALQLESTSGRALLNRGIAYQAKNDLDRALADYEAAIRLGLRSAAAYNNRGHIFELKKEYERAANDYGAAINVDPRYGRSYLNRAALWQSQKQYAKALSDYTEAIRRDPGSPWPLARKAWIMATCPDPRMRNGKSAVELATKAAGLGPANDPTLCEAVAAAHAEVGEFDRAVEWQEKVVAADSTAIAGAPGRDVATDRARLELYRDKKPCRDPKDEEGR
jgi:tetratricopeptide (TPR) repeat protein